MVMESARLELNQSLAYLNNKLSIIIIIDILKNATIDVLNSNMQMSTHSLTMNVTNSYIFLGYTTCVLL